MDKTKYFILFLCVIMTLIPAQAKTWYVDDDGGANFMSIQTALDAASSGDTICIYAGTYSGFDVNKPYITIVGEGADVVTVSGSINLPELAAALTGRGSNATGTALESVKVVNGGLSVSSMMSQMYEMYGYPSVASDCIIKDCTFEELSDPISLYTDNTIFKNNVISNSTGDFEYALMCLGRSCIIENNTIKNNNADAIALFKFYLDNTDNIIRKNHIESNKISYFFYSSGSNNKIYLNTIINNTEITNVSGTASPINWSSPNKIEYTYNNKTYINYTGNYWPDYTGTDNDNDGIGDTPYIVPNDIGTDYYPLIKPYENYFGGGDNPILTSITITPSTRFLPKSVYIGDSFQFTAIAHDRVGDEMSGASSNWSSSDETVGTIDKSTGLFKALDAGTTTIKAENGSINETAEVTVPESIVTYISLSPDSDVRLYNEKTQQFSATPQDQFHNEMPLDVEWNSSNETVGTIDSDGLFTSLNKGTTTIQAKSSTESYNATTEVKVEVVEPVLSEINVSPLLVYLDISKTQQFTATALDQYGNSMSGSSFSWVSDNTTVGTINETTGFFEPLTEGTTNITASSEGVSGNAQVIVAQVGPDLVISSATTSLSPVYNGSENSNNISATIKNQGTLNADAFNVTLTYDSNTTEFNITGLEAGNSTTISVHDEKVKRVSGDKILLTVSLDTKNQVDELNETNNEYSKNVTVSTGEKYNGGRFSNGYDLVNNEFYAEGNIGVTVAVSGDYGGKYDVSKVTFSRTFSADDLAIPAGATIKSAKLYQGWTWYGDPVFNLTFNGHEPSKPDVEYVDCINGQNVWNVTAYFNANGDNTAGFTSTVALSRQKYAWYSTVLIVVYEADSEPYRQIWVNEGSDCILSTYGVDEAWAYTTFDNVSTEGNIISATAITVQESDDNDVDYIEFNGESCPTNKAWGSDPTIKSFNVTNALQDGVNELGETGPSYFNLANAILEVTIETASYANFTADNVSNYSPLKVNFTDTSTGTPTSWYWEFGDENNSTEQNPTHTYMQEGNYTVSLNVSNSLGSNKTTKTDYIKAGTFISAPVADFSASSTSGEAPLSIKFIDKSTYSELVPPSWYWEFGDGKTSSEQNPTHKYEAKGMYNVSLTITNYGGSNTTTKTNYITVNSELAAPVASFTTDSSSGRVPFTAKFTDKSTGSISSWKWDFGDGSTSTEQNPTHTFVTKGTYTITLAATGPGGTKTTTGTITATDPLTSNNYNGGIPLTTTASGTVSGGLWFDSYPGFATSASKTFSLPAYTDIKWARLYVDIYCGHMQNNYRGSATIKIDANGDNSYELTKSETFDTAYSFPGESGSGPIWLSDHMNRVTSDYLMWYDLTDSISGKTVNVKIDTTKIDSSFDGRVKAMTLVVAYDDGDSDQIYYYVNQGHDTVNPLDTSYTGSTTFSVPMLSSGVDSASLSVIYYASKNGAYTYQGKTLSSTTPSGAYYGDQTWDISSTLSSGTNTLTYDKNGSNYFKIPLALMSVKKHIIPGPVKPTAGFSANTTKGEAPLTVKFTDSSSGTPTSWAWDFDNNSTTDSKEQNPEYIYTTPGVYSVKLTVTNAAGTDDEIKTSYITVFEPGSEGKPDLSISGVVNPQASTVFAREPNTINVPVENSGYDPVTNIMVSLYASDVNDSVPVATTNIYTLAGQETTTVSLKDPTIRNLEGGTVTYTAKVDPENLIAEYNETNNNKSSYTKSVKYNGYKGKGLYWEGGSNITTKQTYDLRGDLIYSTQSDSAYKSVGWSTRTETWSSSDLPLPKGATLEKVLLYISYNWDTTPGGVPDVVATFNGKGIDPGTPYTDKSNFGGYEDYKYGLYPGIDVTKLFNTAGNNTLTLTPNSKNSNAIYPSTLVVLYKDSSATRKQIFINEECDELAVSENSYGTTAKEATAYAPFIGLTIDPEKVRKATLYSFAGSAGPSEGNLYFNGNTVAKAAWKGTLSTASAAVFNVTEYLSAKTNEAQIQGTESGGMDALQQFLVIEYTETAPVAAFSADVMSGDAPLTVKFTDESTGSPASWAWDFDNDGRTDSEEQNPSYTYETPGNYTVKLTVTNPWNTSTETKEDYITVKKPYLPKANFSATPTTGISPLIVKFTDLSSRAEKWNWDFGDGSSSLEQNPASHTYATTGNYTVNLTVSNSYGTDTCTTEILVKEFKSEDEEENYSVSFNEIEDINGTTVVINSSSGNVSVENNTIKIKSGKLNISINTEGVTEEEGKLTGNYTNATLETGSETSDLGGYLNNVSTSLNTSLLGSLSSLLKGNASITTKVVPGALDNETESAFQLAGASFAEDLEIAFSMEINTRGLDGVEIKNAYISMTVPGDYVDSHGGPEDFVVMSLHNGNVTVLETSYTKSGDYYVFTAYSPDGFSVKALVSYTPIGTESSHESGGGGDSSEKLSIIPAEASTSSGAESEETSTEESGTGKAEIMPTYSQESKQGSNLSTKPADEETKTSPGGVPGFEWGLAVLGVLLVFGMKRRGGGKRE